MTTSSAPRPHRTEDTLAGSVDATEGDASVAGGQRGDSRNGDVRDVGAPYAARASRGRRGRSKKDDAKETPWYIEIPIVIVVTLAIVFTLQTFVGRVYQIPSGSMEPTLHGCTGCVGDRIVVDKLTYRFSKPEAGDVVVFRGPESWNQNFVTQRSSNPIIRGMQNIGATVGIVAPDENDLVKRVVATGGQTVQCMPGDPGVMVDHHKADDSFILRPPTYPVDPATGSDACGGAYFGPITVPEGNYFVMGDNRTNSADSRYHLGDQYQGTIPEENIIGKVRFIILPFSRIGGVD